jgi:uncharacterized protein
MTPAMIRSLALILCFSMVGCSVLQPQPDRSRFFRLTAMSSTADHDAAGAVPASTRVYGVGPVKLPAYLDRTELATRVSPTEVTYSTTERWAEPLSSAFTAVLAQDLSALLGTNHVVPYPWPGGERIDYQVEVDVLQFDDDASGNVRLTASWRVKEMRNGAYVVRKETRIAHSRTAGKDDGRVAALSDALRDLGQDIAGTLGELPAAAPLTSASKHR